MNDNGITIIKNTQIFRTKECMLDKLKCVDKYRNFVPTFRSISKAWFLLGRIFRADEIFSLSHDFQVELIRKKKQREILSAWKIPPGGN